MLTKELKEKFIDKVKTESAYTCHITNQALLSLLKKYDETLEKERFSNKITNPLELVLNFYKSYNFEYYEMILKGIESNQIIFNDKKNATTKDKTKLNPFKDDGDVFKIVHEFAHYIDLNLNPTLIPLDKSYLCETFSYYMEKQLEFFLLNQGFQELVHVRRNNRRAICCKMAQAIKYMRKAIQEYLDEKEFTIDEKQIKFILLYNASNTINYFIRYLLGDVCSEYILINNLNFSHNTTSLLQRTDFNEILTLKLVKND